MPRRKQLHLIAGKEDFMETLWLQFVVDSAA
jgi:hypothetical protein